jgi:phosphoenolpyruvate carboxykinase (GTP)
VGVPISAVIFGGRRRSLGPLVYEALSWDHGVYLGATLRSEAPASGGEPGVPRSDPMAMLPYCAYNMGDYFGHWLRLGQQLYPRPRIFRVNWFRTDSRGQLVWPGFGENIRVLDWVLRRIERSVDARSTPIGLVPHALNTDGLSLGPSALEQLYQVDVGAWLREAEESWAYILRFGLRVPPALRREHEALQRRLRAANN